MTDFEKAKAGLKPVFDAIPKGKMAPVFVHASNIEVGLNKMAAVLSNICGYFLETTGEESPFMKKIDEVVPRPPAK